MVGTHQWHRGPKAIDVLGDSTWRKQDREMGDFLPPGLVFSSMMSHKEDRVEISTLSSLWDIMVKKVTIEKEEIKSEEEVVSHVVVSVSENDVAVQWTKATYRQKVIIYILYTGLVGALAAIVVAGSGAAISGAAIGLIAATLGAAVTSLDRYRQVCEK